MSMPEFPKTDPCLTREQAINMILTSIAMEELALSHILEGESDKIKHVLDCLSCNGSCQNIELILKTNKSVSNLIGKILDTQIVLKNKMELALEALPPYPIPCPLPCPECPHCIMCPPICPKKCSGSFEVITAQWCKCTALSLCENQNYCYEISLCPSDCSRILLPYCGQYMVYFQLEPFQSNYEEILIEVRLTNSCKVQSSKHFSFKDGISITGSTMIKAEENAPYNRLSFLLNTPDAIKITNGKIYVTQL